MAWHTDGCRTCMKKHIYQLTVAEEEDVLGPNGSRDQILIDTHDVLRLTILQTFQVYGRGHFVIVTPALARRALYRVLVQGFRRCQAVAAVNPLRVGSLTEHGREFFTGRPIWRTGGVSSTDHPEGYVRSVDGATGAVYWSHPAEEGVEWETTAFWE